MHEKSNIATLEREPTLSKPNVDHKNAFPGAKGTSLLEEEQRLRKNLSRYLVLISTTLCGYAFVLEHIRQLNKMFASSSYVSLGLILIFFFSITALALTSGYQLDKFGITLKNGKKALKESILFTLPILAGATLAKWGLIHFSSTYQHHILFNFHAELHPTLRGTAEGHKTWVITLLLYVLLAAPLQEVIARGGVQSGLRLFLSGKHRNLAAILVTSLIFCTVHLALPIYMVLLSFSVGLFWGWLFYRHKTLIGVCVSHALIGGWFFWFLGALT